MSGPPSGESSAKPRQEGRGLAGAATLVPLRRFVLLFVPLALAWIIGSDLVVAAVAEDLADAVWFSILKGVLFVAVTAWLLYAVVRSALVDLERDRALLRAVVEEAPDLIIRATVVPELRFEYVSSASTALGGYTPEEYYQDPELIRRAVHPEDAERLDDLLAHPSSERRMTELRFLHRDDGSVVWTETGLTWDFDEAGHATGGVVAVVRDVTERYEAQRTARLLATAVEAAGESVMVTDTEGTIQYVNPAYERLSGYSRDELVGRNPRIVKSGRQSERFYARLWSTLKAGGTFRGRFVNRAKDGRLYEQQTTITPVRGNGGNVTHFVAVGRDVTVELEINRQMAATERSQAVAELAAGTAHDFRNLLNVVSANVELLETGPGAQEARELTADIGRAASVGTDLVTRLLEMARPTRSRRELAHLPSIVRELEGIMRGAASHAATIVLELDDVLPVQVDRVEIEQAVLNLVRNASQAMPDGGQITISVGPATRLPAHADRHARPGGFVRLAVADTGTGMDREQLAKVYDLFYTTKEGGTGLGVPMVRRAVEAHEGYMEFESEAGRGTTVSLYIPAADEEQLAEVAESAPARAELVGGNASLLVIDDDPGLRRAAERALTHLGYEVTTAEDGLVAIRMIEEGRRWDAIVTDLIMPGLGGGQLYERLSERDIRMPVVFMSGHPPELIRGARPDWPTDFLQKPWTVEALARSVRGVLDAR